MIRPKLSLRTLRQMEARPVSRLLLLCGAFALVAGVFMAPLRVDAALPTQGNDNAVQQLADKYAPILHLRNQTGECDKTGQAYYPRPVEMILNEPEILLRQAGTPSDSTLNVGLTAADLFEQGEDVYIELPGNPKSPGCQYERDAQRFGGGEPNVAYAHIVRQPNHDGFALQYWFYFYFNDWNNKHESDWEMIQLLFDVETVEEALETEPYAAGYAQHGGGESADWDDDKLEKTGDRPHVYTATGAQASFYSERIFLGRAEQGAGFGCDDASGPGREAPVEARVVPDEISGRDDPFAWTTFEGRWGSRQSGEFNGPTGPNTKRAWTSPFDWQEDLRETSVQVPISRDLEVGVNVAELFCDVVAFASDNLLVAFLASPWAFVGAGLTLVGAAGVTATRTRFWPMLPAPLFMPRRFGQILSTATRIYAGNPFLFVGIGTIFIPAAIISSLLQIAVANLPFTGPIYDLLMRSTLSQIAVSLGIGSLLLTIAFSAVMACVAHVMDELDQGARPSALDAFRALLANVSQLFLARLRVDVIVTAIGLTIIGLPWAIRRLVCWTFVEWTVMVERQRNREALRASAAIVEGRWWRAFGVAATVVAVGLGTAPLAGLVMLLLTSLPLTTINLISSVLFLALVPWTAIALALLYYDLKARGSA